MKVAAEISHVAIPLEYVLKGLQLVTASVPCNVVEHFQDAVVVVVGGHLCYTARTIAGRVSERTKSYINTMAVSNRHVISWAPATQSNVRVVTHTLRIHKLQAHIAVPVTKYQL